MSRMLERLGPADRVVCLLTSTYLMNDIARCCLLLTNCYLLLTKLLTTTWF